MTSIRCVYLDGAPNFPATDQHPDAERFTVGPYVVDAIGGAPTLAEVEAMVNPPNAAIDAEIRRLEAESGGYVRGIREYMLGNEQRNELVRAKCEALAANDPAKSFATALLAALPSFLSTKGMQNVKALDDEIRALRAQRLP